MKGTLWSRLARAGLKTVQQIFTFFSVPGSGRLLRQPLVTFVPVAAAAGTKVTNGCLKSRPEPGTEKKVKICWTVFKPARASRDHKVPFMMHSHGWGGSRTTDPAAFRRWLDAGYGVLSFDRRGFGDSGGFAHVENPRYEEGTTSR